MIKRKKKNCVCTRLRTCEIVKKKDKIFGSDETTKIWILIVF